MHDDFCNMPGALVFSYARITGDPLHSRAPIVHIAVHRENNEHGCVYLRCRAVCKLPGCVEGHPCVYTWRRRRNAWGAVCALCALRRCAVTTLCTPRARRERSVTTQSIAGQNSVGARWHAVGAPGKRHCPRGRAVTSPRYGKCKIICFIF